jgi:hypothetical protein
MTKNKLPWSGFDAWLFRHLSLYATKPYILDNHLRPQVHFINGDVRVFSQYRHQEAQAYVNEQLGHEFDYSVRRHEFKYDRPTTNILTDTTYNLWRKIYDRDIEMFNDLK